MICHLVILRLLYRNPPHRRLTHRVTTKSRFHLNPLLVVTFHLSTARQPHSDPSSIIALESVMDQVIDSLVVFHVIDRNSVLNVSMAKKDIE